MRVECSNCEKIVNKKTAINRKFLLGEVNLCSKKCAEEYSKIEDRNFLIGVIAIIVAFILLLMVMF